MARMPRLTRKLVLIFLAFGAVPIAIVSAITLNATSVIREKAGAKLAFSAQTIGDKIDRNLYERYGDAQAFGFNELWLDKTSWYVPSEKDNRLIRTLNRYMTGYAGIYVLSKLVDPQGKLIACNSRDDAGNPLDSAPLFQRDYSQDPVFIACMKGEFTTKQPNTAPGNSVATGTVVADWHNEEEITRLYPAFAGGVLTFAAPVTDRDGKIVCALINYARFGLVEEIIRQSYDELAGAGLGDVAITVVDHDGRIMLDHDPTTRGHKDVWRDPSVIGSISMTAIGDESMIKALKGEAGDLLVKHYRTGEEMLAGFAPLRGALGFPGMNWAVQVRMPKSVAYAEMNSIRTKLDVTAGLCLFGLLGVGYLVGKKFAKPLVEMTAVAKGISRGELDQHVVHQGRDEVGDLADALRGTVEYIRGAADAAGGIGKGDLQIEIASRSGSDVLAASLLSARDSLRRLSKESQKLIQAARGGELGVRGSTEGLAGGYLEIVEGMNQVLGAVAAPIGEAKTALERVAENDLTARMTGEYSGDYAAIKAGLNAALENLNDSLTRVSSAADQVATSASEITQGNQQTAQATSEQAGSLEEITSSLQEITAMSKRSSANAQQARGLAEGARETAEQGSVSVKRMSGAIEKIKNSADETAKIVKTIDEIAFQTNLLALNAAVEAARAGDAGKGFAVVAEEVRALAMRSAEAAKNVAQLITASVKNAEEGVALNHEVTKGFEAIAGKVRGVVEVISEIAAASEQQSDGVAQVNGNIEEMSKSTQQNAATTEETASAAEELAGQAAEMRNLVGAFRLADGGRPAARQPAGSRRTRVNEFDRGAPTFAPAGGGRDSDAGPAF